MSTNNCMGLFAVNLIALALLTVCATAQGTIADDRAHRDTAIHWPKTYDPSVAPVFSHNELLLHTDCHRAFTRLADATAWPTWFILTKDVSIEGADRTIRQGTLLRLKIFDTPIHTRISEFVPDSRLSWIPFGADETETRHGHFHAWHFISQPAGCRVITEETGIGPNDIKDPEYASRFMHRAHDLWLASLKWTSEQ